VSAEVEPARGLSRIALRFTAWSERWIPDAFVFALLATLAVFGLGLGVARATPAQMVDAWGKGFWELIPFTLQMALIIITGYVLASSPPMERVIERIARLAKGPRSAVALVAAFAMLSSWFNWGFSLIFSAMLAREVARRVLDADYRALAAASVLGLGTVWGQGLSSSAGLQMATPGALQPAIREVVAHGGVVPDGIISFEHTVFLWQSLVCVAIEILVVTTLMWFAAPPGGRAVTARSLGIELTKPAPDPDADRPKVPGEWLEHQRWLGLIVVALGGYYLVRYFSSAASPIAAITVNVLNFALLMLGFLLHGTPARLMRAVRDATPAVWGVILQFPFYAGIAGMITYTHLNERIAEFFVSISTRTTFPPLLATYSAFLNLFIPSGGSKWVIEAPYVMRAAHELQVHLGWVVVTYDLSEACANLVQPFWMLPILGLFGLRARDVMGFTVLVFLVVFPLVLVLVTLFGMTLSYPL
jgi:short-chain fatty acids transporter